MTKTQAEQKARVYLRQPVLWIQRGASDPYRIGYQEFGFMNVVGMGKTWAEALANLEARAPAMRAWDIKNLGQVRTQLV